MTTDNYIVQDHIEDAYSQGILAGRVEGFLYGLILACFIATGLIIALRF